MGTRKNKNSDKRFRKTRSKRQRGGTKDESYLIRSSAYGHIDMVKKFIEDGADVNAKNNDGNTALMMASWNGHIEVVRFLLKNGADVNAKNNDDNTALQTASMNGRTEIVAMLLNNGADVNMKDEEGTTALSAASEAGETEVVKLLLKNGADVNVIDDNEYTALDWAEEFGHTSVVELLEKAIESEKKVRGHKKEAMELVKQRDVKIPSLFNFAYGQLPTSEISIINEYELPRKKLGGKRKTRKSKKSKKKIRKTRSKRQRGGDIESAEDDTLIVTIAIIAHGCIIDTNPQQNKYNIRYYSATGDKVDTCDGNFVGRAIHHDELIEYFRQDNPSRNSNSNNTINEIPYYYDDMPYEKIIGTPENQGFISDSIDTMAPIFTKNTAVGVWLISVHKEKTVQKNKQTIKKYEYIYPPNKNQYINLLNINGFEKFNEIICKDSKFNIRTEMVENHKHLPKKVNGVRNFHNWDVQLDNKKDRIDLIRLSYLFDLIKKICGSNCKLNVYDYTCSIICNDNSNIQEIQQGLVKNIEEGKAPFFTGGRKKRTRRKR